MNVAVALACPVAELDAELEGGLRARHELGLGDGVVTQEHDDRPVRGSHAVVAGGTDTPAIPVDDVEIAEGSAWVSEGQLSAVTVPNSPPAKLPFKVRRVQLPQ